MPSRRASESSIPSSKQWYHLRWRQRRSERKSARQRLFARPKRSVYSKSSTSVRSARLKRRKNASDRSVKPPKQQPAPANRLRILEQQRSRLLRPRSKLWRVWKQLSLRLKNLQSRQHLLQTLVLES
jgi:hypothetical protein